MKKMILLVLFAAMLLTACSGITPTQNTQPTQEIAQQPVTQIPSQEIAPPETVSDTPMEAYIPKAYAEILDAYAQAILEGWNPGDYAAREMNYLVLDIGGNNPGANFGYQITDLDEDGVLELILGATDHVTDEFYGHMILDIFTLNADGNAVNVLHGWERSRYYSLGGNIFAHNGSSGASDSFDTMEALENGKLKDLEITADPASYASAGLEPIANWIGRNEEPLYLSILDEIDEITRVGTAGASLTAIQSAAKLLDWCSGTGLDPEEVGEAAARWLQNRDNDARQAFLEKMQRVDDAIGQLRGSNAADLLDTAGCTNTGFPWDEYPTMYIEAIMKAVGLH